MRDGDLGATTTPRSDAAARRTAGASLIELVVVVGVIGVLLTAAVPSFLSWQSDQAVKGAARDAADLLLLARSEAIRTGNQYIVFFGPPGTTDPGGTAVQDASGNYAPMLALDDGPAATANCRIDAGEDRETIPPVGGLAWGVAAATAQAPNDAGTAPFVPPQPSGSTFADPANNAINWVMFRGGDGVPLVFTGTGPDCGTIGQVGTGGAALYLTNFNRDYGIVLSPLGAVRVHAWSTANGWTL